MKKVLENNRMLCGFELGAVDMQGGRGRSDERLQWRNGVCVDRLGLLVEMEAWTWVNGGALELLVGDGSLEVEGKTAVR